MSTEQIEAAAEAMYEDFRQAYPGRFEMTPAWTELGSTQKDEWRRHSTIAGRHFLHQKAAHAAAFLMPKGATK